MGLLQSIVIMMNEQTIYSFIIIVNFIPIILLSIFIILISGPVALSTPCKLIAPGVAIAGTMAITKAELYFEIDEENEENKKIDPKVCRRYVSYICVFMLYVFTDKTCSLFSIDEDHMTV